jgi:undecaprenyl-diphosphatase
MAAYCKSATWKQNLHRSVMPLPCVAAILFSSWEAIAHCWSGSAVRVFFMVASRLGDGVIWYALMLVLPLFYGMPGVKVSLVMLASGAAGLAAYKLLKRTLVRERPFIRHAGISLAGAPLDRYSFPSGHTLHAVSFTWQLCAAFPELAVVLVPLAVAIAVSRVVLGLHYPTDVLVGAVLGAIFGMLGSLAGAAIL